MLTEIKMRDVATFKKEATITTDKKINLIYGLNGAGKSTISNFLYSPTDPKFAACSTTQTQSAAILVYNQRFIQDNFHITDKLNGIFSLSKENKVAEEKIAQATRKLSDLREKASQNETSTAKVIANFNNQKQRAIDQTWQIKAEYAGGDRVLEYCLDGLKGQKEKLFDHLIGVRAPVGEPTRSPNALKADAEGLKGDSATLTYPLLQNFTIPPLAPEVTSLLEKPITGSADSTFAELIDRLGNTEWVKQGLRYLPEHLDADGEACPFCQEQTIFPRFIADIREYFNKEYEAKISRIEELLTQYTTIADQIQGISHYINHPLAAPYAASLSQKHNRLLTTLRNNTQLIAKKIKTPRESQTLESIKKELEDLNVDVEKINESIRAHNERIKNREASLTQIKQDFWRYMRWQYAATLSQFRLDQETTNRRLEQLRTEAESLNKEIGVTQSELAVAQQQTVNVDEAVTAINASLVELAIDGFSVVKHGEKSYRVVRNDNPEDAFHSLSEGEKMMISFLYFCELCKGKRSEDDTEPNRIIIIDDPISSLSHVFVFNVGQLIKSIFFRSTRFAQVFVFTHSLYFFYELTDTNHSRRESNQKLFRISKNSIESSVREMKYEEIQNDYHAYWSIINDPAQQPALIANCMRNIIEYFFGFVNQRDINNIFQSPELQTNNLQAFCRYINRESHSLGQNIFDIKEFDYAAFKEGLKLVFDKTGHLAHYKKMAQI